jgi:hypothetical protein
MITIYTSDGVVHTYDTPPHYVCNSRFAESGALGIAHRDNRDWKMWFSMMNVIRWEDTSGYV